MQQFRRWFSNMRIRSISKWHYASITVIFSFIQRPTQMKVCSQLLFILFLGLRFTSHIDINRIIRRLSDKSENKLSFDCQKTFMNPPHARRFKISNVDKIPENKIKILFFIN